MQIQVKYRDNTTDNIILDTDDEVKECINAFITSFNSYSRCVFLDTKRRAIIITLGNIKNIEYIPE